ncbi:hypothetical protein E2R58_12900 [Paenibacillus amylolyticus]|uniref:hypothetical protein n=1 Tax=Paenibacillus amylolyticus TaxID=1451 RepID=UPI00105A854E|nr:hypothetical protein [Paenibacillus amylolyticus]TDL70016.1 hypothetical protein E2R58_12900 [Paenibacillus amylolyticus]
MRQLQIEIESIQVSIFCEIVLDVLKKHRSLSINKVLVFAYLIKKERFIPKSVYNGNNTQDIIYKSLSLLSGDYLEFCNSVEFIIKAIHILKTSGDITVENDLLFVMDNMYISNNIFKETTFLEKAIEYSKNMNERQFMKEVTDNV